MSDPSLSLGLFLRQAIRQLADAGISSPALDARLIAAQALGCDRATLLTQEQNPLSPEQAQRLNQLLTRRLAREPIGRILGQREFWGLPFSLNEATLEPRPDSETLVEAALSLPWPPKARILDMGTGTGCLLLALLHDRPDATGLGLDLAPRAIEAAQANATALDLADRVRFAIGGWSDQGINGLTPDDRFDFIISNPPYIRTDEIETLQPEVREYDPLLALAGGDDGLDPYRTFIPFLSQHLAKQGHILVEVGFGQAKDVCDLFKNAGFQNPLIQRDLADIERIVMMSQKPDQPADGANHQAV